MGKTTKKLTLSAMFLAIGMVLPFLTGQIPQVGNMMLPMHIPVLLCGLICGWQYGAVLGFILPLVRYLVFGMPVLFPTGTAMAFELMTYGLVIGLIYSFSRWKCIISLYRALIGAMIAGRIVWAAAQMILLGVSGGTFTMKMFLAGAFFNAVPGIIIQLVLIPTVMVALGRTGLVHFHTHRKEEAAE
ncbi:ECF transporter S component [Lachnoclostridium sp. An76]|uniref:ECF transporter S component n=1 Tax=Lachnoclostridium sp. An76 TaxID=1965654 RepID=UPI000B389A16|nr:ECF transporter S component [Lachnoclostridium sp. An76]OUN35871.1 ECF transporter S component [Lachnoclostridium sp. An76]